MKESLTFWIEQIGATVLFCALMAAIYFLLVIMFPDPAVW